MSLRIKQILIMIIIILITFTIYSNKSYAVGQMFADADQFLGMGDNVEDVISTESLKETSDFMYKAFLAVAIVVALIVGVIIGVKYIYESAEGQAKLKEAFIPYVVGCLIVFSAFPIWKIVINFGNEQGFMKESWTVSESREYYEKVYELFVTEEELQNASDNEIKGAWFYVKNGMHPNDSNSTIVFDNRDSVIAYLFVEYLDRFASKTTIINEWNDYLNKYWDRTSFDGWIERQSKAIKLFYDLYCKQT